MPLRMARQPGNTDPGHSSSSDGWHTQCFVPGCWGNANRFKTRFALAARAKTQRWSSRADASPFALWEPFLVRLSWFLRRIGHRSWGCGTWRDPVIQCEWELFCSVFVFSHLVRASRCQVSFVLDSKAAWGASRLGSLAALIGALAAEIALAMEGPGMELIEGSHILGTSKTSADCRGSVKEQSALIL